MTNYWLNIILPKQREHWFDVVNELSNGRKESHWCWYFIPNVPGLGKSVNSKTFALTPIEFTKCMRNSEYAGNISAIIYMVHNEVSKNPGHDIVEVLGGDEVSRLKWCSFMTLVRLLYFRTVIDFTSKPIRDIVKASGQRYGTCEYTKVAIEGVEHELIKYIQKT